MTARQEALLIARERKLDEFESLIGHHFARRELLKLALTHSSLRDEFTHSNERLEFLGDSVIGLVVAQHLFAKFPTLQEGDLTKLKSLTVSAAALTIVGKRLGIAPYIRVGKGIRKGRAVPQSLISNAVEAVVGAVYLDAGFDMARELVVSWLDADVDAMAAKRVPTNYKAALQQATQRIFGKHPAYVVLNEIGPDHKKEFVMAARVGDRVFPPAKGKTKKLAEQKAARLALREVKRDGSTAERDRESTGSP